MLLNLLVHTMTWVSGLYCKVKQCRCLSNLRQCTSYCRKQNCEFHPHEFSHSRFSFVLLGLLTSIPWHQTYIPSEISLLVIEMESLVEG